jgi:hypothetical protein
MQNANLALILAVAVLIIQSLVRHVKMAICMFQIYTNAFWNAQHPIIRILLAAKYVTITAFLVIIRTKIALLAQQASIYNLQQTLVSLIALQNFMVTTPLKAVYPVFLLVKHATMPIYV